MALAKLGCFLSVAGTVSGAFLLAACEQKVTPRVRNGSVGAKAAEAAISFSIPDQDAFTLAEGDAKSYLATFWYTLESDDEDCDAKTYKETRDYVGAETVEIETRAKCGYLLTVAIGKSKKAYYKTEDAMAVASGDADLAVRLKRTSAGETVGFEAAFVEGNGPAGEGDDGDGNDIGDGSVGGAKVTYVEIKPKITANCTSCHAPGRSRSSSDLSSYDGAKSFGSQAVEMVAAGQMPPGGALSAADMALFKQWKTDGFLEKPTASGSAGSTGSDDRIVEFRIPRGTGSGAWNTAATPAVFKVGQTLRIYNDDTVIHQMHTNGTPCPHGNIIQPGAYGDCVATRSYTGSPLYDHNTRGDFHLLVE